MKSTTSNDVTEITLLVLVIGILLVGSLWILLPFISGLIWAATLAIATWPLLLRLQQLAFGKRWLAVTVMTALVSLIFIAPLVIAISTVLDAIDRGPAVINDFLVRGLGAPPSWIAKLPLIGQRLAEKWQAVAAGGPEALVQMLELHSRSAATWVIGATGGVSRLVVLLLLTVAMVAILYAKGETAARGLLAFAYRLGGETGERTMLLAGQAVRSVALGVVVTALVQSLLAGLGIWLAGVPHPGLLTAAIFILGIAQIGHAPVTVPAIVWLYWTGHAGWATALLIWSVPVSALDNVLRPILIRRGIELPMLLIIAGVVGGLINFGLVGLFLGPVILAATFALTKDWVARGRS